jgi:CubicO group peptidase (beta-lactamase class C family)
VRSRPGTKQSYSNLSFLPMTEAVARSAGRSFPDLTVERLLRPLGINRAGFRFADTDMSGAATPYCAVQDGVILTGFDFDYAYLRRDRGAPIPAQGVVPYQPYTYDNYPDGGMRISIEGLARYASMWLNGGKARNGHQVLRADLVADALRLRPPVPAADGEEGVQYGLSWYTTPGLPDARVHTGGDVGTSTFLTLLPAAGLAVMIVTNLADAPLDEAAQTTELLTILGLA